MHYQNTRVDSVIGLDVNPSIEISVNRKDKILETEALNEDAVTVLADMDLEGVDLNIGVNAIIGSMVRCGYLSWITRFWLPLPMRIRRRPPCSGRMW